MCGVFKKTMVQFPHKLLILYKKIMNIGCASFIPLLGLPHVGLQLTLLD
jgi:hypothetical protein